MMRRFLRMLLNGEPDMYVCLCNAFTDRCVDRAIADGAATVSQVYRQIGAAPRCGKCKDMIRARIQERAPSAALEPAA